MTVLNKIIWAMDVFEESNMVQRNMAKVLKTIAGSYTERPLPKIEPVYILTPGQLSLPAETPFHSLENYELPARKAMEQKLKEAEVPELLPARIILDHESSLRSSVERLVNYAEQTSAELIVIGTHGRTGISRFLLGSFAETLILQARTPVMVIGENSQEFDQSFRFLFPTELNGDPENPVFSNVIEIVKSFNGQLTLLHTVPRPLEPVFQSGVYLLSGGWVPLPSYMEKRTYEQTSKAARWIEYAQTQGIPTQFALDSSSSGIVHSILTQAEQQNSTFIIMESQHGPVATALLGSITRQVVRSATCPVWVLRALGTKKSQETGNRAPILKHRVGF